MATGVVIRTQDRGAYEPEPKMPTLNPNDVTLMTSSLASLISPLVLSP